MTELHSLLVSGAAELGLTLEIEQSERLIQYLQLLNKWNKAYNLSAVRDPEQMVGRHLLDSLSVVPYIEESRIIDVGSGGGLPGIPLAIMFPERQFTLLDSNGKKTRFLFQTKTELQLHNVTVVHSRVEEFQPEPLFEAVISRAFASLSDMVDGCQHLLEQGGRFYAMKGVYPTDELSSVAKQYKVSASYPLHIPREPGQRHLLVLGAA